MEPGSSVEILVRDGIVSIEPAPALVKIIRRGKLYVATADSGKPLTEEAVRRVRDETRTRG